MTSETIYIYIYIHLYLYSICIYTWKYTNTCIYNVLTSIGPPPCRGPAQLAGASGNFFGRNNTFFLTFIEFLKKILKKSNFSKIFIFFKFLASGVQPWHEFSPQLQAIDEFETLTEISSMIGCIRK